MHGKCKYCQINCEKRAQLFKHYRTNHGSFARTTPLPCLHDDCMCTFKSLNALKVHLSHIHIKTTDRQPNATVPVKFSCLSCGFAEPCTETEFFSQLYSVHLKLTTKYDAHIKIVTLKAVFTALSKHTRVKNTKSRTGRGLRLA